MSRLPSRAPRALPRLPFLGLALFLAAGCTDPQPVQTVNQPPQIRLQAPTPDPDGEPLPIEVGEGLGFEVLVSDTEDDNTELIVSWIAERTDQGGVQLDLGEDSADASGRVTRTIGGLEAGRYQITARVTDTRGATDETGLPVQVFAVNEAPTVLITQPSVAAEFGEGDSVTFVGTATDDRSVVNLEVEWFSNRDGLLNSAPPISSGLMTFSASSLSVGEHTITVRVTDDEELFAEDAVVITVIAEDLPPTQPTITINPGSPLSTDDLSCLITVGSSDPDGNPITYTYAWYRDGVTALVPNSTLPAAQTAAGEEWMCEVIANDGALSSLPGQATVTIGNQIPSVASADLSPVPAYETSVLTCAGVGWSDLDGSAANYDYAWLVDGALVPGITTPSLDGTWFNRDQTVQCELTPNDGLDLGIPVLSSVVTISNSPPTTPTVSVSPTPQADQDDDITCQVDADATDPDGDTFVYLVSWLVDGAAASSYDGQWTIPSTATGLGDTWECQVAADDLEDVGVAATASTTVLPDPGDWVITEVMATPLAVTGPAGEWVELYNNSGSTMDLDGFELHDDGADTHYINASIVVPPGARVVLSRNSDFGTNGGVFAAYEYSGFVLGNTQDQVVLSFDGIEIDRFNYDLTTYSPSLLGRALALDPSLGNPDPTSNDDPSNWCGSSNPLVGPGSDFGTPGGVNDSCACYFSDGDGDGYGTDPSCGAWNDCDDTLTTWSPAAVDICEDGLDQNCDGADAICPCLQTDSDGDGFGDGLGCAPVDCNDANPFVYPGATEACNNTDTNCDGTPDNGTPLVMCPATAGVTNTQCSTGNCLVSACSSGLYDVNGFYSDGCECADQITSASTCSSAISLGSVGNNGSASSALGSIPSSGNDWFVVSFPQSSRPGVGTPTVTFSRNDGGAYRFDTYYSCTGAATCTNDDSWSFTDNADANGGYNLNNVSWPTTLYIRVERANSGLTCGLYQLSVSR